MYRFKSNGKYVLLVNKRSRLDDSFKRVCMPLSVSKEALSFDKIIRKNKGDYLVSLSSDTMNYNNVVLLKRFNEESMEELVNLYVYSNLDELLQIAKEEQQNLVVITESNQKRQYLHIQVGFENDVLITLIEMKEVR